MEFILGQTGDGLKLKGVHWTSDIKDICIVFTPGMTGNIIEDNYPQIWGEYFSKNKIGFLYGHNRGYSHINEIEVLNKITNEIEYKKFGTVYEKFEDSYYDVDLWINKAKSLGYKRIILLGHSLGCNKNVYFLNKENNELVKGLILASPPDIVGMMKNKKFQPNYKILLKEAKELEMKHSNRLMRNLTWDWYNLSSTTFLNMIEDESLIDIFPLIRNPEKFKIFEKVKLPILCFLAEDDNIIESPKKDLDLLKKKALNCNSFESKIFKDTDHCYENKELEVAETILNWIKKIIN